MCRMKTQNTPKMRRKLKKTQNLGKTVYVVSDRIRVGGGRGGGTLWNYSILVGLPVFQTSLPLFQTFRRPKSLKYVHVFRAGVVTLHQFSDDKRSRDRYNVELRFKGYYISAGQTSLLQV